jgi:DNA (cytosine-5)-methyltransferase 1
MVKSFSKSLTRKDISRIPVLSFFTGAGFLDMGFELADFDIIWTNENNQSFIAYYEAGYTAWRQAVGINRPARIHETRPIEHLNSKEIIAKAFSNKLPPLWGIIGGPPCPDFSNGGKHGGFAGKNGRLTKIFLELIDEMRPPFFLIENVAGIFRIKKNRSLLEKLTAKLQKHGYFTDIKILNALDYGLAQDRPRMFLIGITRKLLNPRLRGNMPITDPGWFPFPEGEYRNKKLLKWPTKNKFRAKVKRPPHIPEELTIYPLLASYPSPEELPNGEEYFKPHSDKFNKIYEGDTSRKSFKRLHRFRYSPTACYGNNEVHLHPWKPRRLSVREVLRIQGIPDSYILPKGGSLTSKFKLIGNGVPMTLTFNVAKALKTFLLHLERKSK